MTDSSHECAVAVFLADKPDFWDWLQFGIDLGWVSDGVCVTHDGLPSTEDEDDAWEQGYDPCQPAIRVWTDNI
jgi:hypothetical protein